MGGIIIMVLVIVIILFYIIIVYNKMVRNRTRVEEAWSTIDVFLKKRYDLIPNLVNTVKGYAQHESSTLTEVTRMRNKAMNSVGNLHQKIDNERGLSNALSRLLVSVEAYPELKANTHFLELSAQLKELEGDLEKTRRYYNGSVRENNILIESFPSNMVAGMGSFEKQPFFQTDETSRQTPVVSF